MAEPAERDRVAVKKRERKRMIQLLVRAKRVVACRRKPEREDRSLRGGLARRLRQGCRFRLLTPRRSRSGSMAQWRPLKSRAAAQSVDKGTPYCHAQRNSQSSIGLMSCTRDHV